MKWAANSGLFNVYKKNIHFERENYDFVYGCNVLYNLPAYIPVGNYDRYLIITDSGIPENVRTVTETAFAALGITHVLTISSSEKHKNLHTVSDLADQAISLGCDRRTAVVALGGGLTGNIAGMLAGLLFRGLSLIHIPTTLLAASDSVLSLKQAVNLDAGKNLVGMYYTPLIVLVELQFLHYLNPRHIRAGLCELVKNLLAIMPERIADFRTILNPSNHYSDKQLQSFIEFCIDAKVAVMNQDAKEKASGLVLEYGHTIGHALEIVAEGEYLHGECVAFGMLCSARIAGNMGLLSEDEIALHSELLETIGMHIYPKKHLLLRVIESLQKDNKRGYRQAERNKTPMILLDGLGKLHRHNGHYLTMVPNVMIEQTLLSFHISVEEQTLLEGAPG